MAINRVGGSDEPLLLPGKPDPQKKPNETIRKVWGVFQTLLEATKSTPSKSLDPANQKQIRLEELEPFQQMFDVLKRLRDTNRQGMTEAYDPHYGSQQVSYNVNDSAIVEQNLIVAKELVKFMEKHIGKPEESISKPRLWENIKTLMAEKFKIDLLSLANIKKSQDIPTLLEERFEEFQGIAKKLYERHTDANTYSDLQRAMQKMMVKDSDSSRTKET